MSLLPTVEHETAAQPTHSVIWLHGLGADGHDFAPIVPELVAPHWPALRFVFPHAPVRPVTVNGGAPMRAWFDILGFDAQSSPDEAGIRASITATQALVARERERGVSAGNILLAGFSQGGAIALATALRHADALGGVIGLSTFLPLDGTLASERSAANAAIPVFLAHGLQDPVIVLPRAETSRAALAALGYAVDWRTYAMGHTVCPQEIADLRDWLSARFAAAR